MAYKRFLRDGVFDRLIEEIRHTLDLLPRDSDEPDYLNHYFHSMLIAYQTCKVTLERIEEAIEIARPKDNTGEICVPLCDAANHIKSGILSLHETAWRNTESIREEQQIEFNEYESLIQEQYVL